jgi:hypothetical protein
MVPTTTITKRVNRPRKCNEAMNGESARWARAPVVNPISTELVPILQRARENEGSKSNLWGIRSNEVVLFGMEKRG